MHFSKGKCLIRPTDSAYVSRFILDIGGTHLVSKILQLGDE